MFRPGYQAQLGVSETHCGAASVQGAANTTWNGQPRCLLDYLRRTFQHCLRWLLAQETLCYQICAIIFVGCILWPPVHLEVKACEIQSQPSRWSPEARAGVILSARPVGVVLIAGLV